MQRVTSRLRDGLLPVAGRFVQRPSWGDVEDTILIIQPDHLGDILLSQPAVRFLRDMHPESHLVAVVGPWSEEIASFAWPVDEVTKVAFPGFTRTDAGSPIAPYQQLGVEARKLSVHHPKAAYVLRPDAWWAAWLAASIAPEVITSDDPRLTPFAAITASLDSNAHAAQRALRIAGAVDGRSIERRLELPVIEEYGDAARSLLDANGLTGPYVVIHPGSGAAVKEWPTHRWRAVAEALSNDGFQVILTGSASESDLCDAISSNVSHYTSLAGSTPLGVLIELLRGATLVLGPDCGPLHLAVGVGRPSIHLFGPSDPVRYGPWGDPLRHRVVSAGWSCLRCGDLSPSRPAGCGCMLAIQPDDVISVARELLSTLDD